MAAYTFQLSAGALVRKSLIHEFRVHALKSGLSFEVLSDDGGWVSTSYLLRVSGEPGAVATYQRAVESWARKQKEVST
jgi:hypothetical protein